MREFDVVVVLLVSIVYYKLYSYCILQEYKADNPLLSFIHLLEYRQPETIDTTIAINIDSTR